MCTHLNPNFTIWAVTWENLIFAYAKRKTQISFAIIAKLISAFVFATWIVQSLCFLNPKFQVSNHLLWLYSPVCVGPGRKPRRPVFWRRGSYNMGVRGCSLHGHVNMMTRLERIPSLNEPRRQKTGLRGFRPGPTQTGLDSHRRWLETWNFGFRKQRDCTIQVAKTKALISFAVTAKLICVFVFAYAKIRFSHVAAQMYNCFNSLKETTN